MAAQLDGAFSKIMDGNRLNMDWYPSRTVCSLGDTRGRYVFHVDPTRADTLKAGINTPVNVDTLF